MRTEEMGRGVVSNPALTVPVLAANRDGGRLWLEKRPTHSLDRNPGRCHDGHLRHCRRG
jgi:hypothetical protein